MDTMAFKGLSKKFEIEKAIRFSHHNFLQATLEQLSSNHVTQSPFSVQF